MKKIIVVILAIVIAGLLAGCFSSKEVRRSKRAQRKLDRAIELDPSILKRDTVVKRDTFKLPPRTIVDTFLDPNILCDTIKDTIVIKGSKNSPKVVIRETNNGLQVEAECPTLSDTLYFEGKKDDVEYNVTIYPTDSSAIYEINVSKQTIKHIQDDRTFWQRYGPFLFGMLIFFVIGFVLGIKFQKK